MYVYKIDWSIDFNCMSTCHGLLYAKWLGNHVHFMFIFTFFVVVSLEIFFHTVPLNLKSFLNRSIWPIDGTLTGITSVSQGGPGVMVMKGYITLPRSLELEPIKCSFSVIHRIALFYGLERVLHLYSQHILNPPDWDTFV